MCKRYSCLILMAGLVPPPAEAMVQRPASELPACVASLGPQGHEACRMRMSFFGRDAMGRVATAEQRHSGTNDPVGDVFRGNAPYRGRYNYLHTNGYPVILRTPLPLGTVGRGLAIAYEVMLWARLEMTPETPASYAAPMRVRLSIGDDQGRHRVELREIEVPVSEPVPRPYTIAASGLNLGFEPVFLYAEIDQASRTPDHAAGAMIRVEGIHAAIRSAGH